jgi:hypothetical protein
VSLIGNDFGTLAVEAVTEAFPLTAIPGQTGELSGTDTVVSMINAIWSQTSKQEATRVTITLSTLTLGNAAFFVPLTAAAGDLVFTLLVNADMRAALESTATVTITVTALNPPSAQVNPLQVSQAIAHDVVTLDGSLTTFASTFEWTQPGGPEIFITNANKAVATFEMPVQLTGLAVSSSTEPLVFQLEACNTAPEYSTATVTIEQIEDTITGIVTELRTDMGELRVDGSVGINIGNSVSIYDGDDVPPSGQDFDPLKFIGNTHVDAALGTFDFRARDGIDLQTIILPLRRGTDQRIDRKYILYVLYNDPTLGATTSM